MCDKPQPIPPPPPPPRNRLFSFGSAGSPPLYGDSYVHKHVNHCSVEK